MNKKGAAPMVMVAKWLNSTKLLLSFGCLCVLFCMPWLTTCQPKVRSPGSFGVGFSQHQLLGPTGELLTFPVWYPAGKGVREEPQPYQLNAQLPARWGRIAREAPCRTGQRWPLVWWHAERPVAALHLVMEQIASEGAIVAIWQPPATLTAQALAEQAVSWLALLRQDTSLLHCIETSQVMLLLEGQETKATTYLRPMRSKFQRSTIVPQALILLYPGSDGDLLNSYLPALRIYASAEQILKLRPTMAAQRDNTITLNEHPITTTQGAITFAKQLRQFYRHL